MRHIISCEQIKKMFYSSKDIFEKHQTLNNTSFSPILDIKSYLSPFKFVKFKKKGLRDPTGLRE